jgi:two-component system repressor protein LuxO
MASISRLAPRDGARDPVSVVVLDGDAAQRRSLAGLIDKGCGGRFRATLCTTAAEARAAVKSSPAAIVIADIETIGGPEHIGDLEADTIATSANASLATAVRAMRGGARDFLPKPIGAKALLERLEQTIGGWERPALSARGEAPASGDADFAGFIGRSAQMAAVYAQIGRIAPSHGAVFITGESGTGKELAAQAIHALGGGARPFVALNCGAIPRDLMESEIFGHVRGAFTGATESRAGAAELANGGTLFLDEITEMDVALQAKLLRFVQEGAFRRVGGGETIRVAVRIISATNRDPQAEVAAGRMRADLFHRLHVLPLHLPALRERVGDVALLTRALLQRIAAEEGLPLPVLDAAALDALERYRWPGNVRELANVMRRAVVLGGNPSIAAGVPHGGMPPEAAEPPVAPYAVQERRIIERALASCGGNIADAARLLEISPSTIYRKVQSWPADR